MTWVYFAERRLDAEGRVPSLWDAVNPPLLPRPGDVVTNDALFPDRRWRVALVEFDYGRDEGQGSVTVWLLPFTPAPTKEETDGSQS